MMPIRSWRSYGSFLVALPIPKLVVFYNGHTDTEDEVLLRLSDSFDEKKRSEADIEVRVRMLNVNYGRNRELMEKFKPLYEYAWFVEKVRKNRKHTELEAAVRKAIKSMPEDFMLKKFLTIHLKEVEGMLEMDYDINKIVSELEEIRG